ncbi:2-hydroxyacyl-CoA dehydratase family protein [Paraburkholderia antibiotica]|uniref:2-hydroxyacyl-CoA dehydratase n=1 Tax=Paraburkholderia antibiotica TaxID=2728839 RepID=A0A7Y0A0Y2_9BURK|nr:2-hydroxyacyl-CoA dehydratase family protein [Paraburkholderia antibiotica]NML34491.1 2-hydroxyacyl-CoA dehydratase [Paraburkholderia antibiotica]
MTENLYTPDAILEAFDAIELAASPDGRKTVGYVSLNVPIELIEAAGCVPRRLVPRLHALTPNADRYLDACFDGATRALFEQFLNGEFVDCDLVVIPRTSENYLQLYYYLLEAQRLEPQRAIPPLHLFDLLQTPYRASARYVRDQVERLKARLDALSGCATGTGALSSAVQGANAHIAQFDALATLRNAQPARLSGSAALRIVGALGRMPRARHAALLQALFDARESLPVSDGPRIVVKGCAQEHGALYRFVEECGAVIVADEHLGGQLAVGGAFDETLEPLDAIAHRYRLRSPSLRRYPQAEDDARFMAAVRAACADGVIFWYEANDDVLGWDYPDQKAALDALGVPSLRLLHQPYSEAPDATTCVEIAVFIDSLRDRAQPEGIRQ